MLWLWLVAGALAAKADTLAALSITPLKADQVQTFRLSWDSDPGVLYRVQRSTNVSDLGSNQNWFFGDAVIADSTNASVEIQAGGSATEFFRLEAHPEIFSIEPTFIDSSDTNAVLYIIGQLLPTNATVVIKGQSFTPTVVNTNGVWSIVSLNGLPPGEPVIGTLVVIENGASNVIATLPVQSPILYGTELTVEQLQGPPDEPPASPSAVLKTKTKSNQSNDRMAGGGEPVVGVPTPAGIIKTKTKSNQSNDRMMSDPDVDFGGGEIASAVIKTKTKSNQSNDRMAGANPATGEFFCEETHLAIPGRGLNFAWTCTYRSRTGPTTALGHGWDFSYNVSIGQQADGLVLLSTGDGRRNTFYPNGTNGWSRDEYFMEVRDLNGDGMPDVLFADKGKWLFNPSTGSPAPGKLWKIVDRNGNTITLDYDVAGRLATIVDDLDRTNTIAYTAMGQIDSVTDFSGRVVRYQYDLNGDLVACVSPAVTGTPNGNDFPGGKTNRYTYTSGFADARLNHNLTSITDAKGQTWLQVAYHPTNNPASLDFDAVDFVQRGPYREHLCRYPQTPSPSNQFAVIKMIARDSVGNVTEGFYDSRLRCVRALEYTGRSNPDLPVTETDNRPTGKLRADAPDTYETRWKWNPDSLCALETLPRGDRMRFIYERDFNPSASPRKKGDCRVVREFSCCGNVDTDGDGVGDTGDLAWHFDYDSNFGSGGKYGRVKVQFHWDREGKNDAWSRKGWDGTIKGNPYTYSDFTGLGLRHVGNWEQTTRGARSGQRKGWDGTIKGRFAAGPLQTTSQDGSFSHRAINTKGTGATLRNSAAGEVCDLGDCDDGDSFVTSLTDPRGTVTTGEYDEHGNPHAAQTIGNNGGTGVEVRATGTCHNSRGQLTAITNAADATGFRRLDTFEYYTNGPQAGYLKSVAIDDRDLIGLRLTTTFEYDAVGNVTRIVDPRGHDWKFHNNALNQCVRVESPTNLTARCTTDFIYDANDNLVLTAKELRNASDTLLETVFNAQVWDSINRLIGTVSQVSPSYFITNRYFYDGNNHLSALLSPLAVSGADPNSIATFEYDERCLLFRAVGAPGTGSSHTNQWNYDANGNLQTSHNFYAGPNYDRVYAYDGFGRPVTITDAMSNVVRYAYDRNDNLIYARIDAEPNDGPGSAGNLRYHQWRWTYDGLDRCIQSRGEFFDPITQLPLGDGSSVSTVTYAPNDQLTSVMEDNGHTTRFAYDTVGRLAQITDPKTNLFQFAYDAGGNLTSMVSIERSDLSAPLQQFTRSYAYDSQGRLVRTVDNVGNTNRYAYDSLSRVVHAIDAKGNVIFSVYDDLGRRTLAIADMNGDALPDVAVDVNRSWTYDDNSRLVSSTDDNTNTTLYAYDSLGRLVTTTNADGTTHKLVWSPRSNVAREEDANGTVITNSYDALDRCVRRDIAPGAKVAATTTFETFAYDGLSRLVLASNNVSGNDFGYDSLGFRVRAGALGLGPAPLFRAFDGVGNCLSMTYPSGRVVSYSYDALDQVAGITTPLVDGTAPVIIATFAYEGPGRLGRIGRANNVNTRINWNGLVSPANDTGDLGWRQVSRVNHQVMGGSPTIDRRATAYDGNQNKILRAQAVPFFAGGDMLTNMFQYDPLNRLSRAINTKGTGATVRAYVLDGNGNRQVVLSNGFAEPYLMEATIPPGDFQMNQYTLTPFGSQAYDENGNLNAKVSSAGGQLEYQYDYANSLVQVTDFSTGAPVPVAGFAYDALGRRISKTTYSGTPPVPLTTEFIHGGDDDCDGGPDDIIETRQSGALIDSYVHKLDDGVMVYSLRTGEQPHFYHTDDLGNVLALTDSAGAVIERYEYDDYGTPQFLTSDGIPMATNASPAGNSFLFHSMEWDGETGLYFGHSQGSTTGPMDPKTGRYILRAGVPLRFESSSSFAGNNPWSSGKASYGGQTGIGHPSYSSRGDKPTQAQFNALIDSLVHRVDDRDLLGLSDYSAKVTRDVLKSYFETGDVPTQDQFKTKPKPTGRPKEFTGHVTLIK